MTTETTFHALTNAWGDVIDPRHAEPWDRKHGAMMSLCRLDTDPTLTDAQRAAVLDIVKRWCLTPADFQDLDEGPGYWGYTHDVEGKTAAWHHKLRQVRNHPVDGHRLYDILDDTCGGEP